MCARITLRSKLNLLLAQFAVEIAEQREWEPRYNIAPTSNLLAVRSAVGQRELVALHWGLIPSWAKDQKIASSTINARADTVATKPAFRSAYKKRRCLVLADGYFEWLAEGKLKQPLFYEVDGGQPFAFAGLWECWPGNGGAGGHAIESCTIITTEANELARAAHHRMPVILDAADYAPWLAGDPIPLIPFPAQRMTARRVSRYVNNVRNQGPECLAPVD